MKVRNGFVSNSSTSSFVVIGFEVDKDYEELEQYDTYKGETTVIQDDSMNNPVVGVSLIQWSDSDMPKLKLTQQEINEKFEKAKEIAKELGIDKEPTLMAGSVYC